MINVLVVDPGITDGSAFARTVAPFTQMRKDYSDFNPIFNLPWLDREQRSLVTLNADIVFFHRPGNGQALDFCRFVKALGKPLWIDYDDNMMDVQVDHPSYTYFINPENKRCLQEIAKLADVITVSVDYLRTIWQPYCKDVRVIRNGFPNCLVPAAEKVVKGHRRILWRGSNTHQQALEDFHDDIVQVASQHKDWTWHIFGCRPWQLITALQRERIEVWWDESWKSVPDYYLALVDLSPSVQIVCHSLISFSKGRSEIGWLEAGFTGTHILAPDWPQWRQPGATLYKDKDEFRQKFDALLADEPRFNQAAYDAVRDANLVSDRNRERIQIINGLVGRKCALPLL